MGPPWGPKVPLKVRNMRLRHEITFSEKFRGIMEIRIRKKMELSSPMSLYMGASAGALGDQALSASSVGAVLGNGISSRVRQEVICELQEFGRRRRNGVQR